MNLGHKVRQYINLHSVLSYGIMDILHRCNQNNLPRIKFSLWKAKSISHHLQTVKCHEDRFSGTVVVPRELLLHWNGNMRKRAKIIAGRLKNYHLYHYQRGGRSSCFRAGEVMTGLWGTWTVRRAHCSAIFRAQETRFALASAQKMSHSKRLELPLVRSFYPDGSLRVISVCHNRESGKGII